MYFQSAYPGMTNERGALQLASSTEIGIKTQRYKPRHAAPAGAATPQHHTYTHTQTQTHEHIRRYKDVQLTLADIST